MVLGKKHIVATVLVLALGLAVYLNWQFSREEIPAHDPAQSLAVTQSGKNLGDAQFVMGASVSQGTELTPEEANAVPTALANEPASGEALQDADTAVLPSGGQAGDGGNQLAEARLNRQRGRDEALDVLRDMLSNVSLTDDDKRMAVETAAKIALALEREASLESMIKAKGFTDCVVYIDGESCNVLVKTEGLMPNQAIQIQEMIQSTAGIGPEQMKIIEVR